MDERVAKLVLDARRAAEAIQGFTGNTDAAEFAADLMMRSAVERQFEIIGEALSRLRRLAPDLLAGISDHAKIIGFRNVLAHGYDVVQEEITWDIVVTKLPVLLTELQAIGDDGPSAGSSLPLPR